MSDDYIHIIPLEPGIVPDEDKREAAVTYLRSIAPQAAEILPTVTEHLEFIHCGGNFGKIRCPSCGSVLKLDIWQDWMEADFGEKGFTLTQHSMPCCDTKHSLHNLAYEWPNGFARYDLRAMNPRIGKLTDEHRIRLEEILGCPVRVIYEHF